MKQCLGLALMLIATMACGLECDPVKVQVTEVEFEGHPKISPALKARIVSDIKTRTHDSCQLTSEMPERVRDQFQQHGFFKTLVYQPSWKRIGGTDTHPQVSVLLVVEEGAIYRLDHIAFKGNTAYDSETLRRAAPITDGAVFNVENLRKAIKSLRSLYCSKGYVNFTPVPNAEINEQRNLVSIDFDLDEGAQFRVGKLTLNGEEPYPGAGRKLLNAWQPYVGQVYDCNLNLWSQLRLSADFTHHPTRLKAILNSSGSEISINNTTHIVDFHLEFPDPK